MFFLNIAADDAPFFKSDMLFHKRLPQNFKESIPNIMLFGAGICSNLLGGLVLLSVLYISIISSRKFWVWIFVSSFFASKASNVDSWSSSSVLSARLCTLSTMSFAIFPQNMQIKGQYLNVDATND